MLIAVEMHLMTGARRTVVLATRDPELARELCDRDVVLERGRIVSPEADLSHQAHYRIEVKGHLDARRAAYFEGLDVVAAEGTTTISGPVADQSALHGLLAKVRDLGLPLLSVERGGSGGDPLVTEVMVRGDRRSNVE
jgi:hypothetical protein